MKIVAVTNYPAGIAHTYMTTESFEKKSALFGYEIHVETQGMSRNNMLHDYDIKEADYVICAIGKGLSRHDKARFTEKKMLRIPRSSALKDVDDIFKENTSMKSLNINSDKIKSIQNNVKTGIYIVFPFMLTLYTMLLAIFKTQPNIKKGNVYAKL